MNSRQSLEEEVEAEAARLLKAGKWVSGDALRLVDGEVAANLLGVARDTLRNWSYVEKGPKPYRLVANGPRVYSLVEILGNRRIAWAA